MERTPLLVQQNTNDNHKWFRYSFLILTTLNLLVNIIILVVFIKLILTLENSKAIKQLSDIRLSSFYTIINQIEYVFSSKSIDDVKYLVDKLNKEDIEGFFLGIDTCIVNECG